MANLVIFIHGGGEGGYETDTILADSLRKELGDTYEVHNPQIHFSDTLPDFGWLRQIGNEISSINEEVILVAHSFGASMLLKYLSENQIDKKIEALFLIAAPYWSGEEYWKQGIKLQKNFADNLPEQTPIFFYHCKDDEEVPFSQLDDYKKHLKRATYRELETGGHQLDNDLSIVAQDIELL